MLTLWADRSVESSLIKKSVEATYSQVLPKGGHPFVYLSIEIEPHRVDVNVHPTKREVNFLYEDEIVEIINQKIGKKLEAVDTSRSFLTQTLIPGTSGGGLPTPTRLNSHTSTQQIRADNSTSQHVVKQGRLNQTRKPNENELNRVDHRAQKITTLLKQQSSANIEIEEGVLSEPREWKEFHYRTLKRLRADVRESMHNELFEVFRNHTFVGIVDESRRLAAIQHGVKLYLVDYASVR